MTGVIKQQEDKFIDEIKKGMAEKEGKMSHEMENGMRVAYSSAAFTFRILGRHEGDGARRREIFDALGFDREEESNY